MINIYIQEVVIVTVPVICLFKKEIGVVEFEF
jgi:hypothetical protein